MNSFFEPRPEEPPRPEPKRHEPPPWLGRPRGVVAAGVPLELVLARTGDVAVALSRFGACADGFEAELTVLLADDEDGRDAMWEPFGPRAQRDESGLRLGVRYADGSKAELDALWEHSSKEPPVGPLIIQGAGGGGGGEWYQQLWFWPLPPAGPLTFALEWIERGVELQLHEVDAAPILGAAQRAPVLFAAEQMPDTPGFTSSTMYVLPRTDEDNGDGRAPG